MCRCDVQTYCFGLAASMGAFLLGAGRKGKRYSMPNARIMIHQPLGGASGQARAPHAVIRSHVNMAREKRRRDVKTKFATITVYLSSARSAHAPVLVSRAPQRW